MKHYGLFPHIPPWQTQRTKRQTNGWTDGRMETRRVSSSVRPSLRWSLTLTHHQCTQLTIWKKTKRKEIHMHKQAHTALIV